jgi:hypothetical protein
LPIADLKNKLSSQPNRQLEIGNRQSKKGYEIKDYEREDIADCQLPI